jgi:hypothetical protein
MREKHQLYFKHTHTLLDSVAGQTTIGVTGEAQIKEGEIATERGSLHNR